MNNTLIPFAIFFIGIIAIQHFNRKALLKLTVEEKAKLIDYTSGVAIWRLIPIIILLLGFSAFMYWKPSIKYIQSGLFIYLGLILLSSIVSNFIIHRKYKNLGFPEAYIRTTLISSVVTILLMIGFFACIAYPLVKIRG